ncbi:MAG: signal peptidase I [Coriobacteriia bacterium]|nr:signal peptidase I [Coriobacteriia bacterium]
MHGENHGASPSGITWLARWLGETAVLVVVAFAVAMALRANVAQAYEIPTPSMEPTIMVHDRVIAEKLTVRFDTPAVGDVVVITDPTGGPIPFIKRVVALQGQQVDLESGAVMVDGKKIAEPYTHGLPSEPITIKLPLTAPLGYVWVMGDNRTNSKDSRFFGPVPITSIIARALCVYWPPQHIGSMSGLD